MQTLQDWLCKAAKKVEVHRVFFLPDSLYTLLYPSELLLVQTGNHHIVCHHSLCLLHHLYPVPANLTESFTQQLHYCQKTQHRDHKIQGGSGELHIMHHIKPSVAINHLLRLELKGENELFSAI